MAKVRIKAKRQPFQHPDKFGWGDPHAADMFLHPGSRVKFNPNHVPAGSPEGGQFTSGEVGNGAPKNITEAANAIARREVVKLGKGDNREHLVAVDSKTGKIIFRSDGIQNEVRVDPATDKKLDDPKQAIDIVHNHPPQDEVPGMLGSSLSPLDVMTLHAPGERSVTAVTHDGSYFTASKTTQDKLDELFSAPDPIMEILGISRASISWKSMQSVLMPAVKRGDISAADSELVGFHSMWKGIAQAGYIDYSYHLSDEAAKIMDKNSALSEKVTKRAYESLTRDG